MGKLIGPYNLVFGSITYESPVNLANASITGDVKIGALTYFNYSCVIGDAEIGRFCSIGQEVIIAPGDHQIGLLTTHPINGDPGGLSAGMMGVSEYAAVACTSTEHFGPWRTGPTKIGHDVWIGLRAVILRDVTIGTGAVVAAGSIVTKDVPPFAIVAGIPAKIIRYRLPADIQTRIEKIQWWNWDLSFLYKRDFSNIPALLDELDRRIAQNSMPAFNPEVSIVRA